MRPSIYIINLSVLSITLLLQLSTCSDESQKDNDAEISHLTMGGESSSQPSFSDHQIRNDENGHFYDSVKSEGLSTDGSLDNVGSSQIEKTEDDYQPVPTESIMSVEVKKEAAEDKIFQTEEKPDKMSTNEDLITEDLTYHNPEISNNIENNGIGNEEISDLISKSPEDNDAKDTDVSSKKQRYFPLLYTFGSLFTSFLAEFGEVSSSSESAVSNASDSNAKNLTVLDGLLQSFNTTSNSTEQGKKSRFTCSLHLKNSTETANETAKVAIINSTELLEMLNFSKNQKSSPCVLVMFYTKWCHFSARAAPEYNALARAFPQLDVLAVDTSHFSYLNAKFGTVAVPNIMLFHSRSAVRFNHTTRDLDNFIQFVSNNTGLEPVSSVAVMPEDFEGPLSSQVVQGRDWLLWLAWTFILVCSTYGFFFSLYGQAVIARLRVLWQEHQHIE